MGETPKPARTQTRLTKEQKAEIREIWRVGSFSYEELMKKYGVSKATIARTVEGITHGEDKDEDRNAKAAEAAAKTAVEAAQRGARVSKVKEDAFQRTDTLLRLLMRDIGRAIQANNAISTISADIKAIKTAIETVSLARDELYTILGIDPNEVDEKDLPELVFRIIEDDDIRSIQERNARVFDKDALIDIDEDDGEVVVEGMDDIDDVEEDDDDLIGLDDLEDGKND